MTGTACEIYDNDDGKSVKNLDLLSAWLFGRITANCILHDLSYNGCAILIPSQLKLPSSPVKLAIMSPENEERVHVIINAEVRWVDEKESQSFNKAGFMFLATEVDIIAEVSELISYQQQSGDRKLKCSVLNI